MNCELIRIKKKKKYELGSFNIHYYNQPVQYEDSILITWFKIKINFSTRVFNVH